MEVQTKELKASLVDRKKQCEKVFADVEEVCRAFEADHKSLYQKKGNQANALRSLKEEVVIAQQKSLKYFDQAVEPLGIVQDVMLKKA